MPENLIAYVAAVSTVLWFVGILVWLFRRKFGSTKTVRATIVNKQVNESFSRYSGVTKQYYVTFQIGNKRRSFRVSEFSYRGYHKGKNGTLKYRGRRLIDFR